MSIGAGDRLSFVLAFAGLTKPRMFRIKYRLLRIFGIKAKGCGCSSRQEKLNRLGWRLTQLWRREHRLFTVAIVGTTVAAWLAKWLLF